MEEFGLPPLTRIHTRIAPPAEGYVQAIVMQGGRQVQSAAQFLIRRHNIRPQVQPREVTCYAVTLRQLGLPDYAPLEEIQKQGSMRGLGCVTPDEALRLATEFKDQPLHESLYLMMFPLRGSRGYDEIFRLGHESWGRDLDTRPAAGVHFYRCHRFIFVGYRRRI